MADDTSTPDVTRTAVPIGSIVAYLHDGKAPTGWLVCNGKPIPPGVKYERLRRLIGDETPDLKGMFLRGAGQSDDKEYHYEHDGPRVVTTPQKHATAKGGFKIVNDGDHDHGGEAPLEKPVVIFTGPGGKKDRYIRLDSDQEFGAERINATIAGDGDHSHEITGGDDETRPNNYAVNFIIKAF